MQVSLLHACLPCSYQDRVNNCRGPFQNACPLTLRAAGHKTRHAGLTASSQRLWSKGRPRVSSSFILSCHRPVTGLADRNGRLQGCHPNSAKVLPGSSVSLLECCPARHCANWYSAYCSPVGLHLALQHLSGTMSFTSRTTGCWWRWARAWQSTIQGRQRSDVCTCVCSLAGPPVSESLLASACGQDDLSAACRCHSCTARRRSPA